MQADNSWERATVGRGEMIAFCSRALSAAALLAVAAAGVACSGRGGGNAQPTVTAQPAPAVDPAQALSVSAAHLVGDVTSGRASFSWEISRDGFNIKGDGEYTVQAGNLHLIVHYRGHGDVPGKFQEANDSELLVLGDQTYISSPALAKGWVLFTPQELGSDWTVLQRVTAAHSPIDILALGGGAATTTAIGLESIDGDKYAHYQRAVDAGTLMGALADAYGSQGQIMLANRFSGPITTDVWLDPDTLLPRRIRANGTFSYLGASTRLSLTVDITDLNHVDGLPAAPKSATPLSQLGQ